MENWLPLTANGGWGGGGREVIIILQSLMGLHQNPPTPLPLELSGDK